MKVCFSLYLPLLDVDTDVFFEWNNFDQNLYYGFNKSIFPSSLNIKWIIRKDSLSLLRVILHEKVDKPWSQFIALKPLTKSIISIEQKVDSLKVLKHFTRIFTNLTETQQYFLQ